MKKIILVLIILPILPAAALALINSGDERLSEAAQTMLSRPALTPTESSKFLHELGKSGQPWASDDTNSKHGEPISKQWKESESFRATVKRELPAIEKYKQLLEMGELIEPEIQITNRAEFSIPIALLCGHRWLDYWLESLVAEGGHWEEVQKWVRLDNRLMKSYMRQTSLLGVMIANVVWDNNLHFLADEMKLNPKLKLSQDTLDSFQTPDAKSMMKLAMEGEFRVFAQITDDNWRKFVVPEMPWYARALRYLPKSWVLRPNELINHRANYARELIGAECEEARCLPDLKWAESAPIENPAGKMLFLLFNTGVANRYEKLKIRFADRTKLLAELHSGVNPN